MLRGCGGAGMPGAGATELSPAYKTFHPLWLNFEKFNDISAKTSDGATINQEKERFKRVLGVHEQSSNHSLTSLDN